MRFSSILLLVAVLVVCALPAFGDGFYSVYSSNGTEVWAVGNSGLVFRSIDGGVNWTTLTEGSGTLRAVSAMSSEVWIVGDNGSYYNSHNGGASWNSTTLAGGATLRAIAFVTVQTGWVAGNSGTIFKTTNGGASWSSQNSTTSQQLNALAFLDTQTGYAAGTGGTLLKTTNGGTTWTSVAQAGWTREILSVSAPSRAVFVTGVDGFCSRSTDDGATWTGMDFITDSKSDVNSVYAFSETNAYFVGGGGFIRSTSDGGATYTYAMHQMHAKLNDIFFYSPTNGWACSEKNNGVLRTTDGGATWQLPQGTTVTYQWVSKFSGGSIGNTFCVNPKNKNIIYVVMGNTVYMSGDRGENWVSTATIPSGGSAWSFYVSPKDTNIWIAATSGGPDSTGKGVRRSTNRGATWTTKLRRNFTSYGMPLEMDPEKTDTVIFAAEGTSSGPDGILYISKDFGATWDTLAHTSFRSPCDIVIVPGNTNLWYVGDGTTGTGAAQMWRSTNYGLTWTSIYSSASSEIPMIAVSRLRNTYAFATAWSGTSFTKSTNAGLSWSSIASTNSTWGADIAKDDPNVVLYGTYGGGTSYLSTNAGASFTSSALSGSNSGILAYDRATFLAHQASSGVLKYVITYTVPTSNAQIMSVDSPNGGEAWDVGSVQNIQWVSTGVSGNAKIELSRNGGSTYSEILAASTANDGSEAWTVTGPITSSARIRVSSVTTPTVLDASNSNFNINQQSLTVTMPNGGETWGVGSVQNIQWASTGFSGPVMIELSRNGGSTYETIIASTTNDGTEPWTVSGALTSNALIRVSSISSPSVLDVSNSSFTIISNFALLTKMLIHDGGVVDSFAGDSDSLDFGTGAGATDGIDAVFGEYEQPPVPPIGSFDVRWKITGTEGSKRDIRDTLGGTRTQVIYTGLLQTGLGGYPFVLKWNSAALPAGSFTLRDQFGGTFFSVNMKVQDSLVITDESITQFKIIYDATNTVYSTVQQNWNIVSLPVTVGDQRKTQVFPTSVSNAFAYSPAGYVNDDTLEYGVGYWLKFPTTQTVSLAGGLIPSDTIDVVQGWNIIGSISAAVSVGSIVQIPGGIVATPYYGYTGTAYSVSTSIDPMKGYWVKSNQNGKLVLPGSVARTKKNGTGILK